MQWLMPVIPALWEVGGSPGGLGVWEEPGQHGKTLSLLKIQKITLGGWGGWITRSRDRDHPGQYGETPSLLKIQKISWAWWRVPVIAATQEAEAGELPEPRRRRLRWAEITPLHSSLGNKSETPSQKKKKNNNNNNNNVWGIIPFKQVLKKKLRALPCWKLSPEKQKLGIFMQNFKWLIIRSIKIQWCWSTEIVKEA